MAVVPAIHDMQLPLQSSLLLLFYVVCNFFEPSHHHWYRHIPSRRGCSFDGLTQHSGNTCNFLLNLSNGGGVSFDDVTDEFQKLVIPRDTRRLRYFATLFQRDQRSHGSTRPSSFLQSRGNESFALLCSNGEMHRLSFPA